MSYLFMSITRWGDSPACCDSVGTHISQKKRETLVEKSTQVMFKWHRKQKIVQVNKIRDFCCYFYHKNDCKQPSGTLLRCLRKLRDSEIGVSVRSVRAHLYQQQQIHLTRRLPIRFPTWCRHALWSPKTWWLKSYYYLFLHTSILK